MSPRRSFEIAEVPRLDLAVESALVDIGFLGGQEHRQAFADIFGKVLRDSGALLAGHRLERIESRRSVRVEPPLPIPVGDLTASPAPLARALYDSGNETLTLHFEAAGSTLRMGIRFDNPEFWIDPTTRLAASS
jgi:hypothetical protein